MELAQIEAALAIAKLGTFSKAAESLFLSQSALSQQIGKLEKEMGVLLFERSTRTIRITSAGQTFLDYAEQIINLTNQTRRSMREFTQLERGQIIIGVLPIMGYLGFASLISGFRKRHPNITLSLIEGPGDCLVQSVLRREIDAAIFSAPPSTKFEQNDFSLFPLLHDEVVLITHADHPLASRQYIDLAETASESYIIFKKSNYGLHKSCINACLESGFTPNIIFECTQLENIVSLVAEGLGVAMIMERAIRHFPRSNIRVVHFRPQISRTTVLGMSNSIGASCATRAFRDFALQWINISPYCNTPIHNQRHPWKNQQAQLL